MKVDLLIKNGRVIDEYSKIDESRDIAVKDGLIIDAEEATEAKQTIDATGCIVTPGLIDYHGHTFIKSSELSVYPEAQCFPTGVTTIVDAGTAGCDNIESFLTLASYSRVRQYAYLHVNPGGIPTVAYPEQHDPKCFKDAFTVEMLKKHSDVLLGLKVRESKKVVGSLGLEPLKKALELSAKAGKNVCCHTTDGPVPSNELVQLFRKGDVYAHVFHGRGFTILGEDGHVMPEFFKAKQRGVIFDAANGKSHFAFRVARAAIADGFLPDIISTDVTTNNSFIPGLAFSLPHTMSRYLTLGLSINEIIACVTANPAKALHQEKELGSLACGTCADIAIHRIIKKDTLFTDSLGEDVIGTQLFKTELTIRDGKVVYRQIDF